jgi:dihydroorotate dehydrogenase
MQNRAILTELLSGVLKARNELSSSRRPPLVVKLAPDLDEQELTDIASAVASSGIDGVIISNTTLRRPSSLVSRTCLHIPSTHCNFLKTNS